MKHYIVITFIGQNILNLPCSSFLGDYAHTHRHHKILPNDQTSEFSLEYLLTCAKNISYLPCVCTYKYTCTHTHAHIYDTNLITPIEICKHCRIQYVSWHSQFLKKLPIDS